MASILPKSLQIVVLLLLCGVRVDAQIVTTGRGADASSGGQAADANGARTGNIITETVEVSTNSAIVLESPEEFSELSIANPEIADISTISTKTLYIMGKQSGRTTLVLIRNDGSVLGIMDVRVTPDISELTQRLSEILPNEEISVHTAKDGLVLTGTVSSQAAAERAIEISDHYAPGKISNLLAIREPEPEAPDLARLEADLAALFPSEDISASASDGAITLGGEVSSEDVVQKAMVLAERYAAGNVTSAMTVAAASPRAMPTAEDLEARLLAILPEEPVRVHRVGNGYVISGEVSTQERVQQALQVMNLMVEGAQINNLMTVPEKTTCVVKTRRGEEITETRIPCREEGRRLAPEAPSVTPVADDASSEATIVAASQSPYAPSVSLYPRPRTATTLN